MLGGVSTEIIIIFVLIIANGFFSASEIAIVSARRSRLQQQADAGKKSAQTALNLAENPDRFLATVQVGITLIGTLTAAFSGASLSQPLASWFNSFPALKPYADTLALGSVVMLLTYFQLVLGELVPKRLGMNSSERFSTLVAPFMDRLSIILRPAVATLTISSSLVMRLLGQRSSVKQDVTEEDIVYLTREGAVSGSVESGEEELITRVFRFTDRPVSSVMTPRTEVVALEVDTPLSEVIRLFQESGYTRVPLYENTLDNIVGVLYAKDLLGSDQSQQNIDLKKLARPPFFASEYQHIDDLLATLRRRATHMAIIIDEYSQVTGLVTLEDIVEELIGEIQDEYDEPENSSFVRREDGSWLVDAMVSQEDVREKLDIPLTPEEERAGYKTLAGMLLSHMGRIPTAGDTTVINGYTFEIVDMDGRRIDKVLIRKNTDDAPQNNDDA